MQQAAFEQLFAGEFFLDQMPVIHTRLKTLITVL
jgi:hypothetical protein